MSELRSWTIVGITGVIWAALILTGVVSGNTDAFSTIADVVPLLLLAAYVVERWLWRIGPFPRLIGVPMLVGTWEGELVTQWVDGKTKASPAPKRAYLAVSQTMTTIAVRLLTDESVSDQLAGAIAKTAGEGRAISYLYLNKPAIGRRTTTSPMHHGAAILTILDGQATRLEGDYWTERESKGTLAFGAHAAAVARTFAEAAALSYEPHAT
jgi:SMODS-associating 2TM, beta-strand rich effector domain